MGVCPNKLFSFRFCVHAVAASCMQGSISFPIFVLHGALGQLFYKKIIATKVRLQRDGSAGWVY